MHISGLTHSLLLSGNSNAKSSNNFLEPSQIPPDRRRLQEQSDVEVCLELTFALGLGDVLGVALGGDAFNTEERCNTDMICDIKQSPMYDDSVSDCTLAGGKIVEQAFTVCGQDTCLSEGCPIGSIPPNYDFVNVPLCFAKGCADGTTDYLLLGLSAYDMQSTEGIVPATFTQSCGVRPQFRYPLETCFLQTFQLYANEEDPIVIAYGDKIDFLTDPDICGYEDTTCDFASTDLYVNATAACTIRGGKIVDQNFYACGVDFFDKNVRMDNLPLCLASSCSDETDYIDMLVSTFSKITLTDAEPETSATLLRECAPIPVDDSATPTSVSTASSAPPSGSTNSPAPPSGSTASPAPPSGSTASPAPPSGSPDSSTNRGDNIIGSNIEDSTTSSAHIQSLVGLFALASAMAVGMAFSIF